jgi:hypothetical protein
MFLSISPAVISKTAARRIPMISRASNRGDTNWSKQAFVLSAVSLCITYPRSLTMFSAHWIVNYETEKRFEEARKRLTEAMGMGRQSRNSSSMVLGEPTSTRGLLCSLAS